LLLLLGLAWGAFPRDAEAKGTFYLVELRSGIAEGAHDSGQAGLSMGLTAGLTFKPIALPVRFYLLGNLTSRNGITKGAVGALDYHAERRELDLYVSQRVVVPMYRWLRGFVEGGIGQRYVHETVSRSDLGSFREGTHHLLVVIAAGLQARVSETFSVGVRGELIPFAASAVLTESLTGLAPSSNRRSLMGQIGIHF
jgi:hypothetical protein